MWSATLSPLPEIHSQQGTPSAMWDPLPEEGPSRQMTIGTPASICKRVIRKHLFTNTEHDQSCYLPESQSLGSHEEEARARRTAEPHMQAVAFTWGGIKAVLGSPAGRVICTS